METKTLVVIGATATVVGAIGYLAYKKGVIYFPTTYRILNNYKEHIQSIANKHSLDPSLIAAIIFQESGGNPLAISSAGAIGLMQIMPATGMSECGYSPDTLKQVIYNIECGAKYLKSLYDKTGDIWYAVAKYYGGTRATPYSTYGKPPVYQYVQSVQKHYERIKSSISWV